MYTKTWFKDLAERCAKTFVGTFLAVLFAGATDWVSAASNLDAVQAAAVAGIGAVISILFSVASAWASTSKGTASLVGNVVDVEELAKLGPLTDDDPGD